MRLNGAGERERVRESGSDGSEADESTAKKVAFKRLTVNKATLRY